MSSKCRATDSSKAKVMSYCWTGKHEFCFLFFLKSGLLLLGTFRDKIGWEKVISGTSTHKSVSFHSKNRCAIFKPHARLCKWYWGSMESCSPCSVYFTSGIYQNVWNICTRRHSCHSKTLSCEQPAASHYAKSNKTVELSLVSQSNISKYSLTTHIGRDLEVCLCADIEDNGRGNYRHEIPCLQREQSKQLSKPQIHQIWKNTRKCFCVILNGDVHLCVCLCVCFVHKILSSTLQQCQCLHEIIQQLISVKQKQH